jgi:hypothetical protein
MDTNQLFSSAFIEGVFLKGFAILSCFIYVIYSIVLLRQTRVMVKTVEDVNGGVFLFISLLQLIISFILLFLSFVIIKT